MRFFFRDSKQSEIEKNKHLTRYTKGSFLPKEFQSCLSDLDLVPNSKYFKEFFQLYVIFLGLLGASIDKLPKPATLLFSVAELVQFETDGNQYRSRFDNT